MTLLDPGVWTGKIFDGGWVAADGGSYAVTEPATGGTLGTIGQAGAAWTVQGGATLTQPYGGGDDHPRRAVNETGHADHPKSEPAPTQTVFHGRRPLPPSRCASRGPTGGLDGRERAVSRRRSGRDLRAKPLAVPFNPLDVGNQISATPGDQNRRGRGGPAVYSTHEMRMVRTEESGLEEWACPTCGRRMLLRWPPHYEKRVIEPGDARACHVGSAAPCPTGTGGSPDARPAPAQGADERRWRNARRWLRETGVDAVPPAAHVDHSEPV